MLWWVLQTSEFCTLSRGDRCICDLMWVNWDFHCMYWQTFNQNLRLYELNWFVCYNVCLHAVAWCVKNETVSQKSLIYNSIYAKYLFVKTIKFPFRCKIHVTFLLTTSLWYLLKHISVNFTRRIMLKWLYWFWYEKDKFFDLAQSTE